MLKPGTKVLLRHKEQQSTAEFATMLEKIAQKLKETGQFTFVQGEEQIQVQPSGQIKAEYKYEVKGDKHEFEIEFEWYTGERAKKTADIE